MVIEKIFVTSDALSAALDPTGRAPATAVRRLRERGLISGGIELRPRRAGRLRGAAVYYCALNIDAAESVRDGDEASARRLAEAATTIEATSRAWEIARSLLDGGDLRRLSVDAQGNLAQLAREIARERHRLAIVSPPLLGLVTATDDRTATVETNGELVVLPRESLAIRDLDRIGCPVAIRSHRLRTGALVHSVEEAFSVDAEERRGARQFDPFAMREELRGRGLNGALERALAGTEPVRLVAPLAVAR